MSLITEKVLRSLEHLQSMYAFEPSPRESSFLSKEKGHFRLALLKQLQRLSPSHKKVVWLNMVL